MGLLKYEVPEKEPEEVTLRRMSAPYLPYISFCAEYGSFDKGVRVEMNRRIIVPDAFKDPLPKMHTFSIRGVNIEAKDRKTAIKIYNHKHRS